MINPLKKKVEVLVTDKDLTVTYHTPVYKKSLEKLLIDVLETIQSRESDIGINTRSLIHSIKNSEQRVSRTPLNIEVYSGDLYRIILIFGIFNLISTKVKFKNKSSKVVNYRYNEPNDIMHKLICHKVGICFLSDIMKDLKKEWKLITVS